MLEELCLEALASCRGRQIFACQPCPDVGCREVLAEPVAGAQTRPHTFHQKMDVEVLDKDNHQKVKYFSTKYIMEDEGRTEQGTVFFFLPQHRVRGIKLNEFNFT